MARRDLEPLLIIVEDERPTLLVIEELAITSGFSKADIIKCTDAKTGIAAIDEYFGTGRLVAVVSDLSMRGTIEEGWAVLRHAYKTSTTLDLAVYTAYADARFPALSGEAIPPFTVFEKGRAGRGALKSWLTDCCQHWQSRFGPTLVDASTKRIYEEIAPIYAGSSLPILVLGESGTGKEGLAQTIHEKSNQKGPLVSVNCGGLEPTLAFSELFGHTANAFTDATYHELGKILEASGYRPGKERGDAKTFLEWLKAANPDLEEHEGPPRLLHSRQAEARAGTLFLDEVATLPPKVMAGLLRVLETGDVVPLGYHGPSIRSYCRVVAATNEVNALRSTVNKKRGEVDRFRNDLFFRLAGAILTLSPLRERHADDIRNYVNYVVWGQLRRVRMPVDKLALESLVALYQDRTDELSLLYQAGNFRTLRNLVHRAALIATADGSASIRSEHVELAIRHGELRVVDGSNTDQQHHIREVFRAALVERGHVLPQEFVLKDLQEVTEKDAVAAAYGFLRCNLIIREPPDGEKKYYESGEIQTALSRGLSRNVWLHKKLKQEHIAAAANQYFQVQAEPSDKVSIVVEKVRLARPSLQN